MKTFFFYCFTVLLLAFSSINIVNAQRMIMVNSKPLFVSNPENNTLYKGIENYVQFYCPFEIKEIIIIGGKLVLKDFNEADSNKKAKADDVWRLTQEDGHFSIIPDCDSNFVEVIFVGKKYSVPSIDFRSVSIPVEPNVRFGGCVKQSSSISRGSAINSIMVEVFEPADFPYQGINYQTVDFKVQITHEGKTEEFLCQGGKLNREVMESTSKLQVGDRLVIYDVNVLGGCGLIHLEDRLDLLVQ